MPKLEPMQQPPTRGSGRRARVMRVSTSLAEINVVPLVDVMLVLLVIFMVAAPLMQQGFPVQLPQSRESMPIKAAPVTVTVPSTFRRDRRVLIDKESVTIANLAERLKQALSDRSARDVVLAGDGDVTFQDLVTVWDAMRAAGISNVGIQTQPPQGRQR
jgi:biopolymer transport protein TolR